MMPATLKTTMRGPADSQASRNVPGPLSSRLVTTKIFPPRPPKENFPPPSAPGNAGTSACGKSSGLDAQGMNGLPFFAHSASCGATVGDDLLLVLIPGRVALPDGFIGGTGQFSRADTGEAKRPDRKIVA